MNRFNILAVPFLFIFVIIGYLSFISYARDATNMLMQQMNDIRINYAVDAAVDEMIIGTTDLGMDYADFERMKVNPEVALETYSVYMLENLGYLVNQENKEELKTLYTPAFAVVSYDGWYLGKPTNITSSSTDIVFDIKRPFTYKQNGTTYALNLGFVDCKSYKDGVLLKTLPPISQQEQLRVINQQISELYFKTLMESFNGGKMTTNFYLPTEVTEISRTNPIKNPSVLAYFTNYYQSPGNTLDSFAIGGSRVVHEQFVGCYYLDENYKEKRYAYTYLIPDNIDVVKVFENPTLAALDGWYYDIQWFVD